MPTLILLTLLLIATPAAALQPGLEDVYVRVVDVGAGLCTVTTVPGDHYMVYDTGHWFGKRCLSAVREIVGDKPIDLLVLSHADSDHLGDADLILQEFEVRRILRTGDRRPTTNTWLDANEAIGKEATADASVMNLQTMELVPGTTIPLGDATVTLVAGWGKWTDPGPTAAEKRNAISIVVRLDYRGSSVLFTGDTVGRRIPDLDSACKDAEERMVLNVATAPLKADVLLAPHHGANNASSTCFIDAVQPQFVIFSAGHNHKHPRAAAAERYVTHGVVEGNMFRTDRGDDEGGKEWAEGRIAGCHDKAGDDDVEILLMGNGFQKRGVSPGGEWVLMVTSGLSLSACRCGSVARRRSGIGNLTGSVT